jgi:hypothetical protein
LEQANTYQRPCPNAQVQKEPAYAVARRDHPALVSVAEAYFGSWGRRCMLRVSTRIYILCITRGGKLELTDNPFKEYRVVTNKGGKDF